ncbi:hypothetical protein MNBD_GAMMA12-2303 [hydrothermal vent metagenome]|uniref:Uncharacterized protein n=1 Tax=hydrothermal vent metagenome TaxID=652676 RepID=A0A3B0YVR5_9ZZZZ
MALKPVSQNDEMEKISSHEIFGVGKKRSVVRLQIL